MSELISGKEALIALANDQEVEYMDTGITFKPLGWSNAFDMNANLFFSDNFKFRLKPHTIKINGIEVPAPFKPKRGQKFYYLSDDYVCGYSQDEYENWSYIAVWRTEEDIKQVVEALRSIFQIITK